jgi:hypothetical protein
MARIRTIKPEFWADEKLGPLDARTRLVFLGLISHADDAGRLVDNVKQIDGQIFPHTDESARESLETLAALGRIIRYEGPSGQRLIQVTRWSDHQRVVHASSYVLPPPPDRRPRETLASPAREPQEHGASPALDSRAPILDLGSGILDRGPRIVEEGAGAREEPRADGQQQRRLSDQPPTATAAPGAPWPIAHPEADWPEPARTALRVLSLSVQPKSWPPWRAEIDAMLDGMPGHVQVGGKSFTAEDIGKAVVDFVANGLAERPNISVFRGYVRNARKAIESERARAEQQANDQRKRERITSTCAVCGNPGAEVIDGVHRHEQCELPRPPTQEQRDEGARILREARERAQRRDPTRAA